jgi:hypothetical protein
MFYNIYPAKTLTFVLIKQVEKVKKKKNDDKEE